MHGPKAVPSCRIELGSSSRGANKPSATRGSRCPRRLQPRILIDLVFELPQGGTLLPACFTDGRPLPMTHVLGPLVLPISHLHILKDARNLFAELDSDHRRVSLCLHSVQTRIIMIRLQEAHMECQVKLQPLGSFNV